MYIEFIDIPQMQFFLVLCDVAIVRTKRHENAAYVRNHPPLIDHAKFGIDQKIPFDRLLGPKCKKIPFFLKSDFRFVLSIPKYLSQTNFGENWSILKLFENAPAPFSVFGPDRRDANAMHDG